MAYQNDALGSFTMPNFVSMIRGDIFGIQKINEGISVHPYCWSFVCLLSYFWIHHRQWQQQRKMDWLFPFGPPRPPRLPIECTCGDTSNGRRCTGKGLENHIHFPPFAYLPEENDIDEHYYESEDGFMYSPARH